MAADYFLRQARDADGLAAELDTPEKRRRYIAAVLRLALLGGARARSTREDVDFMTEPFADAESFRASIANYEYARRPRQAPEDCRALETNPVARR